MLTAVNATAVAPSATTTELVIMALRMLDVPSVADHKIITSHLLAPTHSPPKIHPLFPGPPP
jgi:hypothetical protein